MWACFCVRVLTRARVHASVGVHACMQAWACMHAACDARGHGRPSERAKCDRAGRHEGVSQRQALHGMHGRRVQHAASVHKCERAAASGGTSGRRNGRAARAACSRTRPSGRDGSRRSPACVAPRGTGLRASPPMRAPRRPAACTRWGQASGHVTCDAPLSVVRCANARYLACNAQHATSNMRQTACNMQRGTSACIVGCHETQHTTYATRHMRHPTQHATCHVHRTRTPLD